jgi:Icc-related predicted phosphoesterase
MRVVCASDLHEHLVDVPECDLLLLGGDLTFAFGGSDDKWAWLEGEFADWLERVPAREVVAVAGNHDRDIEARGFPGGLRCHYLEDGAVEVFGLAIWGTPWQPWFHDWAFNAPRVDGERFLAGKFAAIPHGTDIVVCHGPPLGYGDRLQTGSRAGSSAEVELVDRVEPPLLVCGHIHSDAGRFRRGRTEIVNASIVDDSYELARDVVVIDLPG